MTGSTLLATGFVVDAPDQGTFFPSAGGNSANPKVQAVYWRCLVALLASARISNPDQRLALFCNVRPPVVDGVDIAAVLERYGVELRLVPMTARLPQGRLASWGNVLYFFDILTELEAEDDDLRFALVDSDVLVTAALDPLWALLDQAEFAGYVVETAEDEPVNGMTRRSMAQAARGLDGRDFDPLPHFGGELFATTIGAWKRNRALFDTMLQQASTGSGPASGVLTEEHIFSIAFALLANPPADAHGIIKRIWTSPRYNTAASGDERLPLWHLPAEKRYGLADFFKWLVRQDFPVNMPASALRAKAMRLCAVPRKSLLKLIRDGLRQFASKVRKGG